MNSNPNKSKQRHVYKSGTAGCGGKAAPTAPKNSGQVIQCPYCDRTFKQDGRYKEHLKNKHANEDPEQVQATNLHENSSASSSLGGEGLTGTQGSLQSSYPVKMPKALLHEWCQKNKKPVPRFKHVEVEGGFHCRVVLPDPKKSEADVILWYNGNEAKTSQEAQHCASVMALFHVMGDRRLDRILPYEYRQQWFDLEKSAEKKKTVVSTMAPKSKSRPFPMQELQSVFMSENNRQLVEGLLNNIDKNHNIAKNDTLAFKDCFHLHDMEHSNEVIEVDKNEGGLHDNDVGWFNNDGSEKINHLKYKANLVKGHLIPSSSKHPVNFEIGSCNDIAEKTCDTYIKEQIRSDLTHMGFKEHYVNAALKESNEISAALDWLMLNVPENQLPFKFAPKASKASVQVLINGNYESSKRFPVEKKSVEYLQEYGYGLEDCMVALSEASGDEDIALHRLFMQLQIVEGKIPLNSYNRLKNRNELQELRSEELVALKSIFGEEAISLSLELFEFNINLTQTSLMPLEMEVKVIPGINYPFEIPIVTFRGPNLSSKLLLQLTKEVGERAVELVGSQMIYELFCVAAELADSLIVKHSLEKQISETNCMDRVMFPSDSKKYLKTFLTNPFKDNFTTLEKSHKSVVTSSYRPPPLRHGYSDGKLPKHDKPITMSEHTQSPQENYQNISLQMKKEWDFLQTSHMHSEIWATRKKLPAFQKKTIVLSAVRNSSVTIICGQTGCGKSTQVPQYLLEEYIDRGSGCFCNIICTQPRRVSAIGLAERVARERGEMPGETVGYSIRLESCQSSRTRILFCTTGVLLRRLLSDPDLHDVTHVIVDEVHERTMEGDLLLLLLQEHLKRNGSKLHVILMSATVEAELFASYFKQKLGADTAIVNIPGYTFPVQDFYLEDVLELTGYNVGRNSPYTKKNRGSEMVHEKNVIMKKDPDSWETRDEDGDGQDNCIMSSASHYSQTTLRTLVSLDQSIVNYDLIEALIFLVTCQASQELQMGQISVDKAEKEKKPLQSISVHLGVTGAVLVFLPGIAEIHRLHSRLKSSSRLGSIGIWVVTLHGSMSGEEQRRVFQKSPEGLTKIVLATNIAETSITIDDVMYVIDTGRHKEMSYDHNKGLSCLQEAWVSKASAKQRRGRAGRVQSGCCFRLYSRQQFEQFEEQQLPEVLRISLDRLCLKVKTLLVGPLENMTRQMLSPPSPDAIGESVRSLRFMNVLDERECLTPLGQYLAQMPVDASVGKMLIFGCMLRCLNPILTVAAALSGRSPFLFPMDRREEVNATRLRFAGTSKSDHMAIVAAYDGWDVSRKGGWNSEVEYCNANFLSRETLVGMEASRNDYLKMLADIGFCSWLGKTDSSSLLNDLNENSSNVRVVKAVICAGFYPNIVRVRHPEKKYVQTESGTISKVASANELRFFTKLDGRVFLHPSSVNFPVGYFESSWLVYTEKVKTSKIFIKNSTIVPAYGLLLFGGELKVNHEKQTIKVDDWLEFEAPARISVLIKEMRSKVDSLLMEKIRNPAMDISGNMVVTALIQLLVTDGF
ncbi:DExH-box ATP-dependent RNA helicase DExH1 isoform X1 [Cryptomeria japonica]|uniref:DExH-box ATP-dependent RNA helicase DExH1 isoform X1 n=2 Tax=Cryptomeria japonica TaxID=3369 RepID=UPI0025AC1D12|nr:DExH-box ATP-dependent RNA helicase DExH1 isoform X1 [Cryptomeria japonica]XP_057836976.1 DExH-box ATP-dependent RNA helicase DExH1 isoform X1 [Cryptomeria japonica]